MKRLISFLLCALILMSLTSAFASGGETLRVFGYQPTESSLDVILYAKAEEYFSEKNFSVQLESINLSADKLTPYSDVDSGTSWIVIIEPSASSPTTQVTVSEIISSLMASFGKKDNIAIYDAASGSKTEFLSTASTVMPIVENALKGKGASKLYDTIKSALTTFSTNTTLNDHKCLLVISRLEDDNSAYYFTDACKDAASLPVTIYAIGLTGTSNTLKGKFQEFKALPEATRSGLAIALEDINKDNAAPAIKQITDNEKNNFFVLSAPLSSDLQNIPDTVVPMTVTLQLKDTKLEDMLPDVDSAAIKAMIPAEGSTEELSEPEPTSKPNIIEKVKDNWPIEDPIINILAAVLLLGIIILIIVLRKRARRSNEEELFDEGETVSVVEDHTKPLSKVTITLTNVKTGEQFTGDIHGVSIKAGRSAALALKGDPSISGTHMEFIWQNGCLYVQDAKSTNGTMLNGKEIVGAVALNQNDMIHIGTSDFRVNWHSNS